MINKNMSLYLERLPTAANPTPLKPSDAKNNGPSQLIQAKKALITEPPLVTFSFILKANTSFKSVASCESR
ncbi:MAG: hypothetical protein RO469_09915 [Thermincola sp.]|nr:hypothetical protein [Thermincola sp.]